MLHSEDRFRLSLKVSNSKPICEFLAENCALSKIKIKDALQKGAVTLKRGGRKQIRIRRATYTLLAGDRIQFHYDQHVLEKKPPKPTLLHNKNHYSIWYKPAGLLSQGSKYGDHCSLQRIVEKFFQQKKFITLVHRLDREVSGIVCVAHNKKTAAKLSELFSTNEVEKRYLGYVEGQVAETGKTIHIENDIDGKSAITILKVLESTREISKLEIELHTGRKHQIRRHLSKIGHPIIGDYRYGGKRNTSGIKLLAYKLGFSCPIDKQQVEYILLQEQIDRFTIAL